MIFIIRKIKLFSLVKRYLQGDFREFLKHGKNYVGADLYIKLMALIRIPILTRLLTPSDFGIIAIFVAIVQLFSIFFAFGIRGAIGRYYHEESDDFKTFLGSNLIFLFFVDLFLFILLFFLAVPVSGLFNIDSFIFKTALVVIVTNVYIEIFLGYLRTAQISISVTKIRIFQSTSFLLLSVLLVIMLDNEKYMGVIYGQLITTILTSAYCVYKLLGLSKLFSINKDHIKYSLAFGLPVMVHLISQYVLTTFDQVIINQLVGEEETGLYSFAYNIGYLQNIVTLGLLQAYAPIFYKNLNKDNHQEVFKLQKKMVVICAFIGSLLVLFSKELVIIFADENFYNATDLVPIIITSYLFFFMYSIYVNYLFYLKKTGFIAVATIIAGLANLSLNYILIPRFGYKVAAITTLLSYVILFVMHFINAKYVVKYPSLPKLKIFLPVVPIIGISLFSFYFLQSSDLHVAINILVKVINVGFILTAVLLITKFKIFNK